MGGVIDCADFDALSSPGGLRGAGKKHEGVGAAVGGEVAEDGEAEACGCSGEGDGGHV